MDYTFLLWVAIIIASTKGLGLIVRRFGLPEVVGCLLAGILLGPSCLGIISITGENGTFLEFTAEFGVIFLMFDAGLTTEMEEMKKNLGASCVVAIMGVLIPLIFGTLAYGLFYHENLLTHQGIVESIFYGVVLTATSVSITVQTLKELGHLGGKVGTTILGAAVIDDILGIIILTIATSLKGTDTSLVQVMINIVLYFIMIAGFMFIIKKIEPLIEQYAGLRRTALFAFAFAFFLSYLSEELFGITDITGAYFAGLMLCQSNMEPYISTRASNVTNMFFGSIFFACVGIKVVLSNMSANMLEFALIFTIVAILTKLLGCGFGALVTRFKPKEALQIGVGMISRGEVALIVAEKGRQAGMISQNMFAPIILVVIVTTLITPILLKLVFKENPKTPAAAEA